MLNDFTTWLLQLITKFFSALWDFVVDAFVNALDLLLSAVVGLLGLIPVPDALSQGLQSFFAGVDPGIIYLVNALGVFAGFAMIGAAYGFRLVRKVVTLFQW